MILEFLDEQEVHFDWTCNWQYPPMGFWEDLSRREEAQHSTGRYAIWYNTGKWSLYRDSDGALAYRGFDTRQQAVDAAEDWSWDIMVGPVSPFVFIFGPEIVGST